MRKILVLLMFLTSFLFANNQFLNPEDAFKTNVISKESSVEFSIEMDKTIYIYDEFLRVLISNGKDIDITKELDIRKPVEFHGFIVHQGILKINVPYDLIYSKITKGSNYKVIFEYQGCSDKGLCYSPMSDTFSPTSVKDDVVEEKITLNETDTITQTLKDDSAFMILLTFFGFGLLLALTPCIFPMIPILSSIIVQHSNKDGTPMSASKGFGLSLIYVLAMSIAYTIAGVLAGLFGANIQSMLQNSFVIVSFALIFVALAFSMFGYYELALPSSWQTKLNKTSDESGKNGSIMGIAIMGFLSALIVGPCVAPPLAGALVYIGQTGDALLGGSALFVMSLGMGVPLLAIGIGAGKYMPKPGGWMMLVSKVFGVVMLAIAIWMIDRIVPSYITMLLFALLSMGSAYYLMKNGNFFGKLVSLVLVVVSILFLKLAFVDDTNGKNLKFQYITTVQQLNEVVKNSDTPIMVDFWATWCVSCKEFDNITFKNELVMEELSKYTLIKIDVTKNTKDDKELMKKFNLFGPPAMIFYKNGAEERAKRMIGYKPANEFLEIIKK
ncbi:MAG: protein-disulfide reductase DsbD [Campylobacterota bacterium]|nr:protein-disulfide reductase DsbD [Campylobacterota bacterium]